MIQVGFLRSVSSHTLRTGTASTTVLPNDETSLASQLDGVEHRKISNYADAVHQIRGRNGRVEAMGEIIRQHIPQLDAKYLANQLSTVVRQAGLVEVLLSTLISGMTLIDRIVTRLKFVPESGGTMFDNTMLFYLANNGETHHSKGTEWPFIVLAGKKARLDVSRRYIRLPGYGKEGHKTLGNWYTTILNAYGNSVDHYGALDVGLAIDQKGPIEQFLG